jgi:hypothetical protein
MLLFHNLKLELMVTVPAVFSGCLTTAIYDMIL